MPECTGVAHVGSLARVFPRKATVLFAVFQRLGDVLDNVFDVL